MLFVYVCVCMRAMTEMERASFLARPRGSRCVNNILITTRMNQSAEGPGRHSSTHSLPFSSSNSDIDPSSSAHHQRPPGCTRLSRSSLVCRGARYNSGSVGRVCCGIILPSVLLLRRLTAEPKSTASLSRIIGQCAWFASFPSPLLPVNKTSPGTAG